MLRWLVMIAALAFSFAAFAQEEEREEQRFALLIGNEAYGTPGLSVLENPIEDVGRIREALLIANFPRENIIELTDVGEAETLRAIRKFEADLKASKDAGFDPVGFFYYSGHGAALDKPGGGRENYLIPTGEDIQWAEDLEAFGVPLGDQIDRLANVGAKAVFVVVDACRNTLNYQRKKGMPTKGLERTSRAGGMLIAFSSRDGGFAEDDEVYSKELSKQLTKIGITAEVAFINTSKKVAYSRIEFQDIPVVLPALVSDFCFRSCESDAEEIFWDMVLNMDTDVYYMAYLVKFPNGKFRDIAEQKVPKDPTQREKLRKQVEELARVVEDLEAQMQSLSDESDVVGAFKL